MRHSIGDLPPPPRALINALFSAVAGPIEGSNWTSHVCDQAYRALVDDAKCIDGLIQTLTSGPFRDEFARDEVGAWECLPIAKIEELRGTLRLPVFTEYPVASVAALAVFFLWKGLILWAEDHAEHAARVLVALGMSPKSVDSMSSRHRGAILGLCLFPSETDGLPEGCEAVQRPTWILEEALTQRTEARGGGPQADLRSPEAEASAKSSRKRPNHDVIDVDDPLSGAIDLEDGVFVSADDVPQLLRTAPHRLPREVVVARRRPIQLCDRFELQHHYTSAELRHAAAQQGVHVCARQRKESLAEALFCRFQQCAPTADVVTNRSPETS